MFKTHRLHAGDRVAVIGAGLGGLTATVASLCKGCRVDLFERASQPSPLQRGNDTRFVHPNILDWPETGCRDPTTSELPYLRWTAASVRSVTKQIEVQWQAHTANEYQRLHRFFGYEVTAVGVGQDDKPWLSANSISELGDYSPHKASSRTSVPGFVPRCYDAVILAVGFGEEKGASGVPFLSYWENDSLHQEVSRPRGPKRILVSGCGDGGLTDALRLRLRNFDHGDFIDRFIKIAEEAPELIERLQSIESSFRRQPRGPDVGLRMAVAYDELDIPQSVEDFFRSASREDTAVYLNSPYPTPFGFGSSLLNRFAVYLAIRFAGLHYRAGVISAKVTNDSRYQVTFAATGMPNADEFFDQVLIRWGPDPAVKRLISPSAFDELVATWRASEDITHRAHWNNEPDRESFYPPFTPPGLPPDETTAIARANFEPAYRYLSGEARKRNWEPVAIGIGRHDQAVGYIVTVPRSVKDLPTPVEFAFVPVWYKRELELTAEPSPTVVGRSVPIGVGIYNYDVVSRMYSQRFGNRPMGLEGQVDSRWHKQDFPPEIGTLGCFLIDKEGRRYLLSCSHVLSPQNLGLPGDRIFLEGSAPEQGAVPIAKLSSFVPLRFDGSPNLADVAVAELSTDVVPDFSPLSIANLKLAGASKPQQGEAVYKIGRTSGITFGEVTKPSVMSTWTLGGSSRLAFGNCCEILGIAGTDFSLAGDSGAVVVRKKDGKVVAHLFGGGRRESGAAKTSIGFWFDATLEILGGFKVMSPNRK